MVNEGQKFVLEPAVSTIEHQTWSKLVQ